MQLDLAGRVVEMHGEGGAIPDAVRAGLTANGAIVRPADAADAPDILIISLPLIPETGTTTGPLVDLAEAAAGRMAANRQGRIIFILSAIAGMPMRRHPDFSRQMAGALVTVRTLAMRFGPQVLVNAVGVGAVGEPLLAGDAAMLEHASIRRPGKVAEVVDTVLFFADPMNTYTTGQMLMVDGGWSAGYGRNF